MICFKFCFTTANFISLEMTALLSFSCYMYITTKINVVKKIVFNNLL